MKYIASILNFIDNIQSLALKTIIQSRMTNEEKSLSDSALRKEMVIKLRKFIKTERTKMIIGFPLIIFIWYSINYGGLSNLLFQLENVDDRNLFVRFSIAFFDVTEILLYGVFVSYILILLVMITKKWRLKYKSNILKNIKKRNQI